jgi:hypothetical protein
LYWQRIYNFENYLIKSNRPDGVEGCNPPECGDGCRKDNDKKPGPGGNTPTIKYRNKLI